MKGSLASSSTEDLAICTNDTVTTGACKIEAAGVAVTDNIADIIAANIVNGITIFGVPGLAAGPYSACSDNALNAGQCSTALNRYVTSTAGADVDGVDGSLTAAIPTGFYSGKQCSMSDTDLVNTNIKSGVTIFGVLGNFTGTSDFKAAMASTMLRDKTDTQMTLQKETVTDAGTPYLSGLTGYRAVPQISKDDVGSSSGSVTYVDRTGWAANTCGMVQATVDLRIADCAVHAQIGAEATWDGPTKGNSGHGVWKLVTRTGDKSGVKGREVWRDERTGLLWSSIVSNDTTNWCKASGSNFITNNPAAENDPSNYCDNGAYQNTGTGPGVKAISACFEDGENYFTNTDGSIDNAGKAGLNLSSTPAVAWRLPTRDDYYQAEVDGIRFVLPETGTNGADWEWTAVINDGNRTIAWMVNTSDSMASLQTRDASTPRVRCVGR